MLVGEESAKSGQARRLFGADISVVVVYRSRPLVIVQWILQ